MLYLNHDINTIFIMLGQKCNLSCKYCMQHSLIEIIQPQTSINNDILEFITNQADKQVGKPIDIRFYGGEPLLYFKDIKYIVQKLQNINVDFSIITNGKLLSQDIVDFFNLNTFKSVAISWDGTCSNRTRLYDVFEHKKELIMQINNLCIDRVLSAYNYLEDFVEILLPYQEEYCNLHHQTFSFTEEEIINFGIGNKTLTDFDYQKFTFQVQSVIKNIVNALTKENDKRILKDYMYISLFNIYCHRMQDDLSKCKESYCGNGIITLNLDLEGTLYQCHNNWIKIGTIYDDYNTYIAKAKELDNMATKNFVDSNCKDCSVLPLCKGGCPLVSNKIRQSTDFCKIRQTMFEPIINFIKDALSVHGDFNKLKGKY